MKLYTEVPYDYEEYHDQKDQIEISESEYYALFKQIQNDNRLLKIYQFFCFIVFLGWFRIILTALATLLYYLCVSVLYYLYYLFPTKSSFLFIAPKCLTIPLRLMLFFNGIVKINYYGKKDKTAKIAVCNHLTMMDSIAVLYTTPCCFVSMDSLKNIDFFKKSTRVYNALFVNRKESGGFAQKIPGFIKENQFPLVVFPEGKVTNGEGLLGFRTGAFTAEGVKIQPLTIRYRMYFTPKGMASPSWVQSNILAYLYTVYSIPFMTLDITFHEALDFKSEDPVEKARKIQLIMANYLGTKAIKNTNKDFFKKEN